MKTRTIRLSPLAFAMALHLCGCASPSRYEWRMQIQAITEYTPPPATRCVPQVANSDFVQRPPKWFVAQTETQQPFEDLTGYGSSEVRAIVRDGVDPDRRSSAIARAESDVHGRDLVFSTQTLRQRFSHATLAESGGVLNLTIAPGETFKIRCTPTLPPASHTPPTTPSDDYPVDRSNSLIVIALDPAQLSNFTLQVTGEPSRSAAEFLRPRPPTGSAPAHSSLVVRAQATQPLYLPPTKNLELTVNNPTNEPLRTYVSFRLFAALDCVRDHELFTRAATDTRQQREWSAWKTAWESSLEKFQREESLGLHVSIAPPALSVHQRRGRPVQ